MTALRLLLEVAPGFRGIELDPRFATGRVSGTPMFRKETSLDLGFVQDKLDCRPKLRSLCDCNCRGRFTQRWFNAVYAKRTFGTRAGSRELQS